MFDNARTGTAMTTFPALERRVTRLREGAGELLQRELHVPLLLRRRNDGEYTYRGTWENI